MGHPNREVDKMVRAYLEAALWSTVDDDGRPLDRSFSVESFLKEAVAKARFDCARFLLLAEPAIRAQSGGAYAGVPMIAEMGHDFWLTRNRHGAGFWDGDWPEPLATALTKIAHAFGEVDVVVYRRRLQFSR